MTDPIPESEAPSVGGRMAKAMYVLMAVPIFAFTAYNLWRLVFEGEIWIRTEGRFVPPDYSLYFWVTLLFYAVMCLVSLIVLALFVGWLSGKLRGRG
jgi:hypothetical protein